MLKVYAATCRTVIDISGDDQESISADISTYIRCPRQFGGFSGNRRRKEAIVRSLCCFSSLVQAVMMMLAIRS